MNNASIILLGAVSAVLYVLMAFLFAVKTVF